MNRTCDKCGTNIPHGNPYICINHNIEYMNQNLTMMRAEIKVVECDELLVLCANCGNRITKVAMKQMLKAIPISHKTVISN